MDNPLSAQARQERADQIFQYIHGQPDGMSYEWMQMGGKGVPSTTHNVLWIHVPSNRKGVLEAQRQYVHLHASVLPMCVVDLVVGYAWTEMNYEALREVNSNQKFCLCGIYKHTPRKPLVL
jgi:hypothetical protein